MDTIDDKPAETSPENAVGCSDVFRQQFRDMTVQLSAYANNAVFEFPTAGPGRLHAAYVRDGVVATCQRLLRFVETGE